MTSQPNRRPMSVTSVDSNRVGARLCSRPSLLSAGVSGGACRPGQDVHTMASSSPRHSSPMGTPRAPTGNSTPGGWPGAAMPPALVISSSGAPPPRESQPATKGWPRSAALSTAGSTATKSDSGEAGPSAAVIARTWCHGPAR